ncbi:MAG: hypothetical protein M3R51_04280 [Candidatus Eremiobacteraeota bacterium]|nr:hypothetical protein [Candidatus Eremiobacteraeota bacterium]
MDHEDERNIDEQLDEQQRKIEELRRRPPVENHTNNTRIDPRPAGDPRAVSEHSAEES